MTNRDRLIAALRGTAPDAVYRKVLFEQIICPYMHENKGFCRDGRSIRSTQSVDAAGRGENADFYSVQPHRRT